jgi:hypothetical protein
MRILNKEPRNAVTLSFTWLFIFACISCTTCAHFPICTKLSDSKPSPMKGIGQCLFNVCQQRHITITLLSENVAEFSGPVKQMKWLQDNYHFLLCDFNQSSGTLGPRQYVSCTLHAKSWIKIIQSANPQWLMLDTTIYCANCLPNQQCN